MSRKKKKNTANNPMLGTVTKEGNVSIDLNFEVSLEHSERMKMLMYAGNMKSFGELVNNSIAMLEWATMQAIQGLQVGAYNMDNSEVVFLDSKFLENVDAKRREALNENRGAS